MTMSQGAIMASLQRVPLMIAWWRCVVVVVVAVHVAYRWRCASQSHKDIEVKVYNRREASHCKSSRATKPTPIHRCCVQPAPFAARRRSSCYFMFVYYVYAHSLDRDRASTAFRNVALRFLCAIVRTVDVCVCVCVNILYVCTSLFMYTVRYVYIHDIIYIPTANAAGCLCVQSRKYDSHPRWNDVSL